MHTVDPSTLPIGAHLLAPFPAPIRNLAQVETLALRPLRRLIELGYFRFTTEGGEHVPRYGQVVYVGNHAGWATLDTLFGAIFIQDSVGESRLPYGAVHDMLLSAPGVGSFLRSLGGFAASWLKRPELIPDSMEVFSVFPEGAEGNCKPFWRAYQMTPWRTGFARLALARDAMIVPWCILGGEECMPSLATLKVVKPFLGSVASVPLTLFPLPTRWKIVALPPIHARSLASELRQRGISDPHAVLQAMACHVRDLVQRRLDAESGTRLLGRLGKLLSTNPPPMSPPMKA